MAEDNQKKEYLQLVIKRWIKENPNEDISSKIADILSSPEERYRFAADLSESVIQLSHMLNVTERTAYRYAQNYGIKLKEDDKEIN